MTMNHKLKHLASYQMRWRLEGLARMALTFSLAGVAYLAMQQLGASSDWALGAGFFVGMLHSSFWGVHRSADDTLGFVGIILISWTAYLLRQEPALAAHWGKSLGSAAGFVFGCLLTLSWIA